MFGEPFSRFCCIEYNVRFFVFVLGTVTEDLSLCTSRRISPDCGPKLSSYRSVNIRRGGTFGLVWVCSSYRGIECV